MSLERERREEHLLGLELFGMRFGLERMRRLLTALGSPQERFGAIHVVGTNGKSSTVRMTAALLEAHGVRAGAYPLAAPDELRRADPDRRRRPRARRVRRRGAARRGGGGEGRPRAGGRRPRDPVRAAHRRRVRRARARAGSRSRSSRPGLGGRHDATGVLRAPVVVLTNVGLEHTRWLGPTVADIAREKLAVVAPGRRAGAGRATAEVEQLARATGARIVRAASDVRRALPGYQRTNFAVACAAAREQLGALDPGVVERGRGADQPCRAGCRSSASAR